MRSIKKVNNFLVSLRLSMSKMRVMKVIKENFFSVSGDRIQTFSDQKELQIKKSSAMPFTFKTVELCAVTINEKPQIRAREVCSALEYDAKTSKTANIIRVHYSLENITQKYQMSSVHTACILINWPKDSQKYNIYTNEEGMCELLLSNQQPKAKKLQKTLLQCVVSSCLTAIQ